MQKQKNDEDMKNLLVTLIMAVTFGLAAEAQSSAYKPNANAASEVSADDTAAIVAYSDTASSDTVAHASQSSRQTWQQVLDDDTSWNRVSDPFELIAYLTTIGMGGVVVAIFFVLLCIVVVFSPIILIAVILYLVFKRRNERYKAMEKAVESGRPVPEEMRSPVFESSEVLWRKGVKNFFIGLGLVAMFLSFDVEELVGIGVLVALYGAGQAVIAYTTRKKNEAKDDGIDDDYTVD